MSWKRPSGNCLRKKMADHESAVSDDLLQDIAEECRELISSLVTSAERCFTPLAEQSFISACLIDAASATPSVGEGGERDATGAACVSLAGFVHKCSTPLAFHSLPQTCRKYCSVVIVHGGGGVYCCT